MFNNLNEDTYSIIISYLDSYIIHNVKFIKNKLMNLDLLILKRTNKYLYDIIDKYYLKKYNFHPNCCLCLCFSFLPGH